jgi:hypothetical protein
MGSVGDYAAFVRSVNPPKDVAGIDNTRRPLPMAAFSSQFLGLQS